MTAGQFTPHLNSAAFPKKTAPLRGADGLAAQARRLIRMIPEATRTKATINGGVTDSP